MIGWELCGPLQIKWITKHSGHNDCIHFPLSVCTQPECGDYFPLGSLTKDYQSSVHKGYLFIFFCNYQKRTQLVMSGCFNGWDYTHMQRESLHHISYNWWGGDLEGCLLCGAHQHLQMGWLLYYNRGKWIGWETSGKPLQIRWTPKYSYRLATKTLMDTNTFSVSHWGQCGRDVYHIGSVTMGCLPQEIIIFPN